MVNSYTEDQLMHNFLGNFQKGGKYSAPIAIHQSELIRKQFTDKKSLSISDLQVDYLNLENSVRNNERDIFDQSRCSHCECSHPTKKCFKKQQKEKGYEKPPFIPRNYNNNHNERNSQKPNTCFRCRLEDNFIADRPNPDNLDNKVHWNTENHKTHAYISSKTDKKLENSTDQIESQKIYASMKHMSSNAEIPRINH